MKITKSRLKDIIKEVALEEGKELLTEARFKYIRTEPLMSYKEVYRLLKRMGHDLKRQPVWYKQKSKTFPNGIPYGHRLRKEFRAWQDARYCMKNPGGVAPNSGKPCAPPKPADAPEEYYDQSYDPEYHYAEGEPYEPKGYVIPKRISNHLYKQIEYAIGIVEYGRTASVGAEVRALGKGAGHGAEFFGILPKVFSDMVRLSCDFEEKACNMDIARREWKKVEDAMEDAAAEDPGSIGQIPRLPNWLKTQLDADAPARPADYYRGRGGLGRYQGDIEEPLASPDHPEHVERKTFEWMRNALNKFSEEGASYPPKTKPEQIEPEIILLMARAQKPGLPTRMFQERSLDLAL